MSLSFSYTGKAFAVQKSFTVQRHGALVEMCRLPELFSHYICYPFHLLTFLGFYISDTIVVPVLYIYSHFLRCKDNTIDGNRKQIIY